MSRQSVPSAAVPAGASSFGVLQVLIVLLAVATGLIHLYLAWFVIPQAMGTAGPDLMFLLNGLGYLGLVAALYLPLGFLRPWRSYIRWALIGYTALTIILWFVMAFLAGDRTAIGYTTKVIEVTLLVLLLIESRQ